MHSQNQKGFTLVEVILFFALSAGFLVIALLGINGRTASIQFTDSMRSLHSFLSGEESRVMNGVNTSLKSACSATKDTGTNEDCVLLGRVVTFSRDSSVATTTTLYGSNLTAAELATKDSDIEKLVLSDPLSDGLLSNYEIDWGTVFNVDKSLNLISPSLVSGGTNTLSLGWLRSPDANRIMPIAFNDTIDLAVSGFLTDTINLAKGDEIDTRLCFIGANDKIASINFNSNSSITLVFDDEHCK